jgi:hypothetical protein
MEKGKGRGDASLQRRGCSLPTTQFEEMASAKIVGIASDASPDPICEIEYLMTEASMGEVARYFRIPVQLFTGYTTIDGESLLMLAVRMNSEQSTRLLLRICPSLICSLDRYSHTILHYLLSIVEPQRLVRIFSSRFSTPPYSLSKPVTSLSYLTGDSPLRYLITLLIHDIIANNGSGVRLLISEGMCIRGVFESMTYTVVDECMSSLGFPTASAFNSVVVFCSTLGVVPCNS